MSWSRFDDLYDDHRKVKKAWRREPAAVSIHVMAVTYCSRHETNGEVDLDWLEEKMPNARVRARVLGVLIECGLFDLNDESGTYWVHDYLDYNLSREKAEQEREWDRRRKELYRDPELIAAIRERDQDRCRYCGQMVNWRNRRGPTGGSYDHVIPRGPNTFENVVVACRRCNSAKNCRTPEQARMLLLDPGLIGTGSDQVPSQLADQSAPAPNTQPIPSRPGPSPEEKSVGARANELASNVNGVCDVLRQCPRLHIDAVGVANAIAAWPNGDPMQAAREVVTWATDPAFQMTNAARALGSALSKQQQRQQRPKPFYGNKSPSADPMSIEAILAAGEEAA